MTFRGKIVEKIENYRFRVNIPKINAIVEADVCTVKGGSNYYEVDEIVFVSWLSDDDWIIIGCIPSTEAKSQGIITVETINANNGTLGKNVKIGGVSGDEIAKMKYTLAQLSKKRSGENK